jgi:hypothetical protein
MRKIWGIGLSRTGTTSLSKVLTFAGLNVLHYPNDQQIFWGINNGGCDITVAAAYKKIDEHFPDSKFVYTYRDKEDWVSSIVPYLERKRNWNQSPKQISIRKELYGDPFPNEEQARKAWARHDADVRKYFENRPDDLLILDILGGDKPKKLWDFLGLENPPSEFPHENRLLDK